MAEAMKILIGVGFSQTEQKRQRLRYEKYPLTTLPFSYASSSLYFGLSVTADSDIHVSERARARGPSAAKTKGVLPQ